MNTPKRRPPEIVAKEAAAIVETHVTTLRATLRGLGIKPSDDVLGRFAAHVYHMEAIGRAWVDGLDEDDGTPTPLAH